MVERSEAGMAIAKKRNYFEENKIVYIRIEDIVPNPAQPRKIFDLKGLEELASSISRYGVIQPISLRRTSLGYELVAGERRLRAARLAGLKEVPCIILEVDSAQSSLLALVENLQRRDLDYIEEAEGLAQLIRVAGYSQEEAARKVGKSQSAVANKLRLLRLSPAIITRLRQNSLSERHARALLRLESDFDRQQVLEAILKHEMNVSRTETYIDDYIQRKDELSQPADDGKKKYVIRDVRMFINTVNRSLELMRHSGVDAQLGRNDSEREIVLTIRIPKN